MIRISVVVCTYNRADMLVGALDSLIEQTLDKNLYEIIVVDNACTDTTAQVVQEMQNRHPRRHIVYVCEAVPGLAQARNTGLQHARAEFVAFMDDDARAKADWLQSALRCFDEVEPTPIALGGVIMPFYTSSKPGWFKDEYEIRTWGTEPRFLQRGEVFSGSNMVLQRATAIKCGGFDVALGVKGDQLSLGEESALFFRMWGAAESTQPFYYDPRLVVFHEVPHYKMTVGYGLKRAFVTGQVRYSLGGHKTGRARVGLIARTLPASALKFLGALRRCRASDSPWNWVLESLKPVLIGLGLICASLGILIRTKQG